MAVDFEEFMRARKFEYLTMHETAERLGISMAWLSELVKRGRIQPKPIRFTERHNSPLFFAPRASIKANPKRMA